MTLLARPRRRSPIAGWAAARLGLAWLAIFALHLQLLAAAVCLSGAASAAPGASAVSVFPICHSGSDHRAPDNPRDGGCPLCVCHACAASAPSVSAILAPHAIHLGAPKLDRTYVLPTLGRVLIAASPRGPPRA